MNKKIYVITYTTEDRYNVISNYYYTNKSKAENEAKKFIKTSSIFKKYEINEVSPA